MEKERAVVLIQRLYHTKNTNTKTNIKVTHISTLIVSTLNSDRNMTKKNTVIGLIFLIISSD
jgi:hypothetical protein